jgi:hypothetical protein
LSGWSVWAASDGRCCDRRCRLDICEAQMLFQDTLVNFILSPSTLSPPAASAICWAVSLKRSSKPNPYIVEIKKAGGKPFSRGTNADACSRTCPSFHVKMAFHLPF